ncbi:MAG: hypothetical protein IAE87_03045 [Rhodobacteraceae bacterium]|jgi:hypothetical protein|nr:hypothetical protein [Paracoccaceae bacterium]
MPEPSIPEMASRVAVLMERRLGVSGPDLTTKLRRGGARLPRRVRSAAASLADTAALAAHPKLAQRLDQAEAARAYAICTGYLSPLGRGYRARGLALSILSTMAFAILVVGVAFVGYLVWRGFV